MTPLVTVILPTFLRPGPLDLALRSVLAQDTKATFDVLVVDNDPEGGARRQIEAVRTSVSLRYLHAPEPGVSNARNIGIAAARGAFIAFLDDDEEAPPGWLNALLETQARFGADAVFGPVIARLPDSVTRHRSYLQAFYSRFGPGEACAILDGVGCGCSLVRRDALPPGPEPFSRERNHIGGEDDLLFAAMKAQGARYAWAPDAWVWEDPDPARLNLPYTLRRAFAHGQGPCSAAAARGGAFKWPTIALWSGVGLAQIALHGVAATFRAVTGSPHLARSLGRMAGGLGKILWFPPFKIAFYGQAAPAHRLTPAALSQPEPLSTEDPHGRHPDLDARAVG